MSKIYESFSDFYPFYLTEHSTISCRRLHFLGSVCVVVTLAMFVLSLDIRFLIAAPFLGYGFAWVGHFVFEKNKPATFKYPLYSLMGDWRMFNEIISGRMKF